MDVASEYDNGLLYERKRASCTGTDTSLIPNNVVDWKCSCESCIFYISIIESLQKNSILSKINKDIDEVKDKSEYLSEAINKNKTELIMLLEKREKIYKSAAFIESLTDIDKDDIESTLKKGVGLFTGDGTINIIQRFPENMERYHIEIRLLKSSVVINITTLCQVVRDFIISIVRCDNEDYYRYIERNDRIFNNQSDSLNWRRIHTLTAIPRNSYPAGFFDNEITITSWRKSNDKDKDVESGS